MKFLPKALSKIEQKLIKSFEDAAQVAQDPNPSTDDIQRVWENFKQTCKDTGNTTTDAVQGEIKEHVTKQKQLDGMSKAEADKWFEQKWKDVKDLGDKVIGATPKIKSAAKFGWLKFVGAVTAIFSGALIYSSIHSGPDAETQNWLNFFRHEDFQRIQIKELEKIVVQDEEFNIFIGGIATAPPIELPAAPPEALPPQIEAMAAMPVKVDVTTTSGSQSYNTTVERVYRNAPEPVKTFMVNNPPQKMDHDYDHPENFHVNLDDYRSNQPHKQYTIKTEFSSATVSY
jgi:hypothetical protein